MEPFFSNGNRDYWTAASVRSTKAFGYTYPELAGDADASAVKATINKLYGNSAGSSGLSKRGLGIRQLKDREVPAAASEMEVAKIPGEVVRGKHRQYLANIQSQKFALNGTYAIYLFIGEFDDTPSAWATSPNLVGTHAVFGPLSTIDGDKSTHSISFRRKPAIQVTGTVPLTSMLLAKAHSGVLAGMAPQTVEEYLRENLHWRVGMFDGTEIPPEDVADLTVTVVTAQVKPAASEDQFPQWSDFTKLTRITQGKPGGDC